MTDDYEKYEQECNRIREENKKLLNDFAQWLKSANLKDKTIRQHLENVEFYINEYLLYEDTVEAKDGAYAIGMFLHDADNSGSGRRISWQLALSVLDNHPKIYHLDYADSDCESSLFSNDKSDKLFAGSWF